MVERVGTCEPDAAGTAGARSFAAGRFRAPRRYLDLLVGAEAAAALLARAAPVGGNQMQGEWLPSMLFLNLCLDHMRGTEDEAFGAAPGKVPLGTFGLLIAAAAQGDTLDEALRRFAAAAPMLRPDLRIQFSRTRRGLLLSFDYEGERDARRDLVLEIFGLTVHCGVRWLTGRRLKAAFVQTPPPLPSLGPSLLRPVVSPVLLRRRGGVTIAYETADADAPVLPVKYQHWAAHELGEFTRLLDEAARDQLAPADAAPPDIVRQVRAILGGEAWGERAAARAMGMSPATLRRRMAEAGSSFRAVSSEARRTTASTLLATEDSLEDVAAKLGFSDARSLRRACHGWFGMAPAAYRRLAR
ncbi:MAG: helix-turn-helix domain-containing protein [Caulobacter sp.]|nr:helix-turn-helix domain-containing protein [Caulobacter sp.]